MTLSSTMEALKLLGDPNVAARKAKDFGIYEINTWGIYMADLKILAKDIGMNKSLALQLIDTEIYEARLLASKILPPKEINSELMDQWVQFFNTWEICDAFCMQLFKYSDEAWSKIFEWSKSDEEFIKRAAYVIMATYGQGHKNTPNIDYEACFPLIPRDSRDDRNFVKKAINWAIREIGKRNVDLQHRCIDLCNELLMQDHKSSKWIAKNALRELEDPNVKIRNHPRAIYGGR